MSEQKQAESPDDLSRRVKVLTLPASFLPELLGLTRFETRLINLPEGATLVRSQYDWATDTFGLLLCHPAFEALPVGAVPPQLLAAVRRTLKPEAG